MVEEVGEGVDVLGEEGGIALFIFSKDEGEAEGGLKDPAFRGGEDLGGTDLQEGEGEEGSEIGLDALQAEPLDGRKSSLGEEGIQIIR